VRERLLSLTMLHERPELERDRKELHLQRLRGDAELREVEERVVGARLPVWFQAVGFRTSQKHVPRAKMSN
jgi:hypothetical protein